MSEKLLKAIAAAFKINADEWIATLKDGDDWLSEDAIAEQVSALVSEKVTAAKTQSRKSGQAEQNAKVLKFVKASGFENPDGLQGDELLTAFNAWKDEQVVPPTGDAPNDQMDKETLAKLPIVKSLILEARQEAGKGNELLKTEFAQYKAQVEQEKKAFEQDRVWDISEKWIEQEARRGKVNLKVDGTDISEQERIKAIVSIIKHSKKIGLNANKEPIFLGDDGEQLKDEFGNPIPFSDVVLGVARPLYGIMKQDPSHEGANPPANSVPGQNGAYSPKYRLASIEDYDKKYMETVDSAERLEISKSKAFHQEKAAGN